MQLSTEQIRRIKKICASHNVKSLYAFGSVTTEKFKPESDIDLIVDISDVDPTNYAENYFNLKFELMELLKREIDLLEEKAIKNPYLLKEIEKTKVSIYG